MKVSANFVFMKLTELLHNWWGIIFFSFCIITLIQLFYYLFFFSRLAFFKKIINDIPYLNPITVIVCARDEARNLLKNLPATLAQKYAGEHEVIVINDNSFDESRYILDDHQKTFSHLEVVELKQEARFIPGKKFPLSVGIKTAKNEIVLLTDADCLPSSEYWIDKMHEGFTNGKEIVLGYGGFNKTNGLINKLARWETFHTALQYLSYALAGIPYMGVGRNLSYKKSVFFRHKGFASHNHVISGDDDLFINTAATKKNTNIVIDKEAFTLSDAAKSWKEWLNQKRRHYSTSKYYKPLHKFLLGFYSFSHFAFYPLFFISLFFFKWEWTMIVFGIRFIIQAFVFFRIMNKLNEKDLFPIFIFLDIWMFFYYIIFSFSLIKKPVNSWK